VVKIVKTFSIDEDTAKRLSKKSKLENTPISNLVEKAIQKTITDPEAEDQKYSLSGLFNNIIELNSNIYLITKQYDQKLQEKFQQQRKEVEETERKLKEQREEYNNVILSVENGCKEVGMLNDLKMLNLDNEKQVEKFSMGILSKGKIMGIRKLMKYKEARRFFESENE